MQQQVEHELDPEKLERSLVELRYAIKSGSHGGGRGQAFEHRISHVPCFVRSMATTPGIEFHKAVASNFQGSRCFPALLRENTLLNTVSSIIYSRQQMTSLNRSLDVHSKEGFGSKRSTGVEPLHVGQPYLGAWLLTTRNSVCDATVARVWLPDTRAPWVLYSEARMYRF